MSDFAQAWKIALYPLSTHGVSSMRLTQVDVRIIPNRKLKWPITSVLALQKGLVRKLSDGQVYLGHLEEALSQVLDDSSIASQVDEVCVTASTPSDPRGDLKVTITREKFDPDCPFLVVVQFFPFTETTRAVLAQFGGASMFQVALRIDPKTGSYREVMMSMDGCDL